MKVYIGSAVGRTVEPRHMACMAPILRDPRYAYFPQIGDALMERVRGMSASNFLLNTDADVHLSIDSDIVEFRKEHIDMLCEQAMEEEHSIVGAIYICRSITRTFPASQFYNEQSVEFNLDPTPVPIRWLATGCVATHRRVFEKLAEDMPLLHKQEGDKAWYDFYETMQYDLDGEPIKLSEDFAFSERAREAGFESYINPAVRVGHVGPFTHRLEDMGMPVLAPQPLRLTHVGKFWRIEHDGLMESDEKLGRLKAGQKEEADKRFEEVKKKKEKAHA